MQLHYGQLDGSAAIAHAGGAHIGRVGTGAAGEASTLPTAADVPRDHAPSGGGEGIACAAGRVPVTAVRKGAGPRGDGERAGSAMSIGRCEADVRGRDLMGEGPMANASTQLFDARRGQVTVRRRWNDWQTATYRLEDLRGSHWQFVGGGLISVRPQPFLHGYVQCDDLLAGTLHHEPGLGPCPHHLKVCVLEKDNDPELFHWLGLEAGAKPKRPRPQRAYPRVG